MSTVTRKARNSLITLLVILIGMGGLLTLGVLRYDQDWTPGLALDLAGGTEIVLKAQPTRDQEVTPGVLQQTVEIIRLRVDGSGVSEAEITTQGGDLIVVSLPGNPSDETIDLVKKSAQLQFRPVLLVSNNPAGTGEADLQEGVEEPQLLPDPIPDDPSSLEWLTDGLALELAKLNCLDPANLAGADPGDPTVAVVLCDADGIAKYVLGPVELTGNDLAGATAGQSVSSTGALITGDYEVRLEFDSEGASKFDDITTRLFSYRDQTQVDSAGNIVSDPRNRFAMVLDGVVISAPGVQSRISNGSASISGGFTTIEPAQQLANQLRFGALPLTLEDQATQRIGPTLGAEQLQSGLLAGLIGLALVVVYSLIQYRALGFVTVASLVVAAAGTYGAIGLLSWGVGYRLSLAGVAGLIVAIGVTADSFIVYFERVRDELREGRSLVAAVEHGWSRARRTILASDAINILAALVLYSLAVGGVRGFAFTLGLTTLIDLAVVMLFTHPMLALLAKTRFFGDGHPASGLDPRQLGREAMYKGRGRFKSTPAATDSLTLAERKAQERAAAAKGGE